MGTRKPKPAPKPARRAPARKGARAAPKDYAAPAKRAQTSVVQRRKGQGAVPAPTQPAAAPRLTGPARYTVARLLAGCTPATAAMLRKAWANGDQLAAKHVPRDGLAAVTTLAAYAMRHDVALVDDYETLIERTREELMNDGFSEHVDRYFVSGCCIMFPAYPSDEGFAAIHVAELYDELLGAAP